MSCWGMEIQFSKLHGNHCFLECRSNPSLERPAKALVYKDFMLLTFFSVVCIFQINLLLLKFVLPEDPYIILILRILYSR